MEEFQFVFEMLNMKNKDIVDSEPTKKELAVTNFEGNLSMKWAISTNNEKLIPEIKGVTRQNTNKKIFLSKSSKECNNDSILPDLATISNFNKKAEESKSNKHSLKWQTNTQMPKLNSNIETKYKTYSSGVQPLNFITGKEKRINYPLCFSNTSSNIKGDKLKDKIEKYLPPVSIQMRYLDFRPFIFEREIIPKDFGYYFKMQGNECALVKSLLEDNGFIELPTNEGAYIFPREWTLIWSSSSIKSSQYKNLKPYQKVNHFPRSVEMTRKDLLYINLSKLKTICANKGFDFLPLSFVLPNETSFLQEEMVKDKSVLWIVKPVCSSQGRGIFVTKDYLEIPKGKDFIVSKYIINPYLINGYKFDMRIYVLMTSILPLRFYVYEEGFARFATQKYFTGQTFKNDKFMHLTNYAINKNNKNFVANSDPFEDDVGSKWSLGALANYFESINVDWNAIKSRIDDLIIKTVISSENNMVNAFVSKVSVKNSCFELFGFDILLDSELEPWLMEVNFSPSLHIDSPLDVKIKGELIAECFDLANKEIKLNPDTNLENKILKELSAFDNLKDFKFTREVREFIWETEEENKRTKKFRILFPRSDSINYTKLFLTEKPINTILSYKSLIENNTKCGNKRKTKGNKNRKTYK